MAAVWSNSTDNDFYSECWNCATVSQVAWLPINSTGVLIPTNLLTEEENGGAADSGSTDNNSTDNGSADNGNTGINNQTDTSNGDTDNGEDQGLIYEALAKQLWNSLGNCTSGIWIFNNTVPYYVNTNFGERVIFRLGPNEDVFAWGINEFCQGRPFFI